MSYYTMVRLTASALLIFAGSTFVACSSDESKAEVAADPANGEGGEIPEAALMVMEKPQYDASRWMMLVTDLDTGEVLIDAEGDEMAEPASVVKTFSVGAAWLKWGTDHVIGHAPEVHPAPGITSSI